MCDSRLSNLSEKRLAVVGALIAGMIGTALAAAVYLFVH